MLIDLHFHSAPYSRCSQIDLEEGVLRAKERGLDALCITDHESRGAYTSAYRLSQRYGITLLVGVELLSHQGDLLCYGLPRLPSKQVDAQPLIDHVRQHQGAVIAAHPYRDCDRSLGDELFSLTGLSAIEVHNCTTNDSEHRRARHSAQLLGLPQVCGSDAHHPDQVGCFATRFAAPVRRIEELIEQLNAGAVQPEVFNNRRGQFEPVQSIGLGREVGRKSGR